MIDFLRVFEDFSKNLKVIVLILTSKFEAFWGWDKRILEISKLFSSQKISKLLTSPTLSLRYSRNFEQVLPSASENLKIREWEWEFSKTEISLYHPSCKGMRNRTPKWPYSLMHLIGFKIDGGLPPLPSALTKALIYWRYILHIEIVCMIDEVNLIFRAVDG